MKPDKLLNEYDQGDSEVYDWPGIRRVKSKIPSDLISLSWTNAHLHIPICTGLRIFTFSLMTIPTSYCIRGG